MVLSQIFLIDPLVCGAITDIPNSDRETLSISEATFEESKIYSVKIKCLLFCLIKRPYLEKMLIRKSVEYFQNLSMYVSFIELILEIN